MTNLFFSIIIPNYNTDFYIEDCLNSILVQTFEDFEVIVVDDCSTDNSIEKIEKISKQFGDRLKLFKNEKNMGVSVSRNKGLDNASGKYICWVDSDDWIEKEYLTDLFSILKDTNFADIIYLGNVALWKNGTRDTNMVSKLELNTYLDSPAKWRQFLTNYVAPPWILISKRELYTDKRYPDELIFEDFFVSQMLLLSAESIFFTEKVIYNYRLRAGSITHTFSKKISKIIYYMNTILEPFWKQNIKAKKIGLDNLRNNNIDLILSFFYGIYTKEKFNQNGLIILKQMQKDLPLSYLYSSLKKGKFKAFMLLSILKANPKWLKSYYK